MTKNFHLPPVIRNFRLFLVLGMALLIASCDQVDEVACQYDLENPDTPITLDNTVLERVDGGRENLGNYLGKLVIVNVWATWCPPCRYEMPSLQALSDRLPPSDGVVLGISVDNVQPIVVREFLYRNDISFTNFVDAQQVVTIRKWKVAGLPETLIFDSTGCLRDRIVGAKEWHDDEIYEYLEQLMDQE